MSDSDTDKERTAEAAAARGAADAAGAADAQERSTLEAGVALVVALRHLASGLRKLAAAEGRILQASIPLLVVGAAALVLFGATLWLCLVALFVWLLMWASGSLLLAIGLLVLIHVLLVGGIGLVLLISLQQASFPRTRTELRMLRRTLRYDLDRITGAIGDPLRSAPPKDTSSSEKEGTA